MAVYVNLLQFASTKLSVAPVGSDKDECLRPARLAWHLATWVRKSNLMKSSWSQSQTSDFRKESSKMAKRTSTILNFAPQKPKPKPPVRTYQPTYRLNPRKRFDLDVVLKILERIVSSELEQVEYNDKVIPDLCLTLVDAIRTAVKEENYDRYRVIVSVTIGQRRAQSLQMFHSFLWDHERDNFASYNFENPHIFANAVVYCIYLD